MAAVAPAAPDHVHITDPDRSVVPAFLFGSGVADAWIEADGALGPVWVTFSPHGITGVALADGDFDAFRHRYRRRQGRKLVRAEEVDHRLPNARLEDALRECTAEGLSLDLRVTPFQAEVLAVISEIPRGQVRSYSQVASAVGRPKAVRAAGSAIARNPVPLLIPCHRVVRNDGGVGGYLFGSDRKRSLLVAEGVPR